MDKREIEDSKLDWEIYLEIDPNKRNYCLKSAIVIYSSSFNEFNVDSKGSSGSNTIEITYVGSVHGKKRESKKNIVLEVFFHWIVNFSVGIKPCYQTVGTRKGVYIMNTKNIMVIRIKMKI